jgi:hypothetical protein
MYLSEAPCGLDILLQATQRHMIVFEVRAVGASAATL